ncbi:hypothetical protein INT45_000704 [Circinella minor]|uniref:Uncharacterized protein n=1 Tax=Circinella minor TaxID=1195481 RepID=A0A8H7RKU1_9FUNG|nr:hypothetical protein INT45_000704 [Circinella minor]
MNGDNITVDRRQRWRNNNRETEKRNSRRITRCKRALKLANKVKYGDIKRIVAKMIDTLYFDIYDELSAEGLPRYAIVAFIIQEAELQLKSRYEIEDADDGPGDVFGSIFSQTRATFPANVFGSLNEAPRLRGDSDSIGRDTEEGDEREREETIVGNGNHAEVEYIIISDDE